MDFPCSSFLSPFFPPFGFSPWARCCMYSVLSKLASFLLGIHRFPPSPTTSVTPSTNFTSKQGAHSISDSPSPLPTLALLFSSLQSCLNSDEKRLAAHNKMRRLEPPLHLHLAPRRKRRVLPYFHLFARKTTLYPCWKPQSARLPRPLSAAHLARLRRTWHPPILTSYLPQIMA
ncbi:hypothetical protein CH063_09490, partial [Colletotrichum higginsianum]